MNINRNTYEEFFLLYVDNELNESERKTVEEFVRDNPDLEEELRSIHALTFQPDKKIVFENKEQLMQKASTGIINDLNYTEFFVLYSDNELTPEERMLVQQFAKSHPQYQQEFELIQGIKLEPDTHIVFADKESLFRKENDDKVIPFRWWRIAAAAAVLLFIGGFGWFMSVRNPKGPELVINKTSGNKNTDDVKATDSLRATILPKPVEENNEITSVEDTRTSQPDAKIKIRTNDTRAIVKTVPGAKKVTVDSNIFSKTAVPQRNDVVKTEVPQTNKITPVFKENTVVVQSAKPVIDEAVGATELTPENNLYASADQQIEVLNTSFSKKNKLRGFFRKATRILDKATNIESSENRGIRIANFEIALK